MTAHVSVDGIMARLADTVGKRATRAPGVLAGLGRSGAYHAALPPDVVVCPETAEEVIRIVKLCAATGTPLVASGAGTSLEGNAAAVKGVVCLDLARMNGVVAIDAEDMDGRIQPGITRKPLTAQLRDTGLFFSIDPRAQASIGGMASMRASGTEEHRR